MTATNASSAYESRPAPGVPPSAPRSPNPGPALGRLYLGRQQVGPEGRSRRPEREHGRARAPRPPRQRPRRPRRPARPGLATRPARPRALTAGRGGAGDPGGRSPEGPGGRAGGHVGKVETYGGRRGSGRAPTGARAGHAAAARRLREASEFLRLMESSSGTSCTS